MKQKRILVAPLDWGLGHATRCIPIIRELISQGAEVIIGSSGMPLQILREEFPQLECCKIVGYNMHYQKGGSFALAIIPQIPKLIRAGFSEHKKLKHLIHDLKIDGVISDNRFGLFHSEVPCVFMTHQVGIIMPPIFKWAERGIYKLNYRIMNRYDQCWIPDFESKENLSGILSHKYKLPSHTKFIGALSRFRMMEELEMNYDLLVVLSGPEPQRTILEEKIIFQLKSLSINTLIVRGTPGEKNIPTVPSHIEIKNHLSADELNRAMLQSKIVLSRSGYSTIMDLAATGRKAILIPTPGQTEQEYLGKYFHEKKIFYSVSQSKFNLQKALSESQNFSGLQLKNDSDTLALAVKNFLESIK